LIVLLLITSIFTQTTNETEAVVEPEPE